MHPKRLTVSVPACPGRNSPSWRSRDGLGDPEGRRSRPSRPLLATLLIVDLTVSIPYTPLAPSLGFEPLPAGFLLALAFIVVLYLAAAEASKFVFYRREASLPSQPEGP